MTTQQSCQSEPNVNYALGDLLQRMLHGCQVRSENTQLIAGRAGLKLDNLITASDRAPVVVEAEYLPATGAEDEAANRLGLAVVNETNPIEAAIALRYPVELANAGNLSAALQDARLSYCVLTNGGDRFPTSGWLEGSVTDLADLVSLVSVPQRAVDQAATVLEQGIERAAALLNQLADARPGITQAIARLLGMIDVTQTRRMSCAIIANAMIFHQRIAGMHDTIKPLRLVCGPDVSNPQDETLSAWSEILDKINYWAIFAIARDLLEQLPPGVAARVLTELRDTAQQIDVMGVNNAHDLTGRIFQRLIADRKYLATFYTRPESAALLARLAVSKIEGVDWSDASVIGKLRIGDFACGTGALLSAVYQQIIARYERAGGDPAALHPLMMEQALYGCDVMPSAIHITGSTLSGVQPAVKYTTSHLYTLAYGRQTDGSVKIGSLELLQSSAAMSLFNTSDPAMRTDSLGEHTATQIIAEIPDEGFDLVIMNPPFTRATNHEGAHADIANPAFAAFNAAPDDQTAMGNRINELGNSTCYHGNAGVASAFAALADRKIKPGGMLALALPLSAAAGLSWQNFRRMLASSYADLTVISIAAADNDQLSFSADTGMAECLVVARKIKPAQLPRQIRYTSLRRRPQGFAQASLIARNILDTDYVRQIEDGPYGGTNLMTGGELAGEMLSASVGPGGRVWGGVRLSDYSLAQTAHALSQSGLWLPGEPLLQELSTAPLSQVARLGLVSRDINGSPPRGPFSKIDGAATATYPALWNHNARKETRIVCEPDSQLQVRPGMESKAAMVWATRTRAHHNVDFRYNSQPLAVAVTVAPSIGGRAWPNVGFSDDRRDYAFAIWSNSTLGLLCHWWHANRQVAGRGAISIRSAETLTVLDFRALSAEQLTIAHSVFDEFSDQDLQPAYLADADSNRALLDRRVVCDLLGFDADTYRAVRRLAAKWCAEPSVHGGKPRPGNAQYAE